MNIFLHDFKLADYNRQEIKAVMKAGKQCMKELSIPNDDDVIERVCTIEVPNRPIWSLRFVPWLDLMDSEENILPESIVQFLADKYDTGNVRRLVTKCVKPMGDVLERTWKCF